MKLISFNVNGIRARFHQLREVMEKYDPDIIGIQETKVSDDLFPFDAFEGSGYHIFIHGQKGHYGVALMAKKEPVKVVKGFAGDGEDAQRRVIEATWDDSEWGQLSVFNGYFPQGDNRKHETKYPAKRKYYADLFQHLCDVHAPDRRLAVMGDFNVAPLDADIGIGENNKKRWLKTGKCSFLPEEREWYQKLTDWGLYDTFRQDHPEIDDRFSWFDYRSRGFEGDPKRGIRIDLILTTRPLIDALTGTGIDYEIRGMEKPSDHCPIWAEFKL